ncbi:MAG: Do family serine endopeptidase, partial [Mucispirillum sp.]|nr:Do family serine endopeptidase [Mucispirillum sp.]
QGGERKFKSSALGSGFVIDTNGYIVTNNHVIEGADEIIIKFPDEKEFKAEIIGTDPLTDLALLKIEPKGAPISVIALGDSDKIEIGDWVIAIGNPLGLGGTVTAGILSAKGRVLGDGPYDNFIQTDVSINPGNSGGPLINMNGEVIGINTAIIQSAQGLGFAVPVNMLKNILPKLKGGKVSRGWLGVTLQPLDENLAQTFGLNKDTKGVLIADVTNGEPASRAGLKAGDIVVAVDGEDTLDSRTLVGVIGSKSPNEKVTMTIIRDGKRMNVDVRLGERPVESVIAANKKQNQRKGSITVDNINPNEAKKMGVDSGVVVTAVTPDSSAFAAGLRQGDVIVWINKTSVKNAEQFYSLLDKYKKGDIIGLKILSPNGSRFIAFNKD